MPDERFKMRNPKCSIHAQIAKLNYQMREWQGGELNGPRINRRSQHGCRKLSPDTLKPVESAGELEGGCVHVWKMSLVSNASRLRPVGEIWDFASKCWDRTEFQSQFATGRLVWSQVVDDSRWRAKRSRDQSLKPVSNSNSFSILVANPFKLFDGLSQIKDQRQ